MVDYVAEFNASFARVTEVSRCDAFFDRFYDRFIAGDDEIAAVFARTDMEHQKEMLRSSLTEMRAFFQEPQSNPYIVTLARIHGSRGHDIPPRMFQGWIDSLVATVREVDPEASDRVELAWRIVMAPGIEFMKFYRDR